MILSQIIVISWNRLNCFEALWSGPSRIEKNTENVKEVRQPFLLLPQRFPSKHPSKFGIFILKVSQILHFQMTVVQELFPPDFQNRIAYFQNLMKIIPENAFVFSVTKSVFIYRVVVTNKTCITDKQPIPVNFTKGVWNYLMLCDFSDRVISPLKIF